MQLPKGFKLKEGVEFDKNLQRHRWRPKKGNLCYYPKTKTIFKYLDWKAQLEGAFMSLDGYAKVKDIKTKEVFWTHNIEVRRDCIPIQKRR